MKKASVKIFLLMLPILLAGCLFPRAEYEKTNYFAVGEPEAVKISGAHIAVGFFNNVTCTTQRIIYRKEYTVFMDNYNKWSQSPDFMVKAYLEGAFENHETAKKYDLNGSIFIFEIDLERKQAVLGIRYTLSEPATGKLIFENKAVFKHDYETADGPGYARAMTGNLRSLALRLAGEINSLGKKPELDKTRKSM